MLKLFLPQATLEEWALDDRADLQGGSLVIRGEPAGFGVTPAVHFVQLVSGLDDNQLVSKVKTEPQLRALGAEQMADSVLLGETAYEVVPGYVAELPVVAAAPEANKKGTETDLLAAFLLDKM